MGGIIWLATPGAMRRMVEDIDLHLVAFLGRYTGFNGEWIDNQPLSRVLRLADGVGRIIEAENKV